jgi:hypothetical protein
MITELKWNSVEDSLPDENVEVMCVDKKGCYTITFIQKGISLKEREDMKSGAMPAKSLWMERDKNTGELHNVYRHELEYDKDESSINPKPFCWGLRTLTKSPYLSNYFTHWASIYSKEEIEERKRLVKEMEEARDRADAKWREEHGFESPEKIWSSIAKKTEEAYFWGNES